MNNAVCYSTTATFVYLYDYCLVYSCIHINIQYTCFRMASPYWFNGSDEGIPRADHSGETGPNLHTFDPTFPGVSILSDGPPASNLRHRSKHTAIHSTIEFPPEMPQARAEGSVKPEESITRYVYNKMDWFYSTDIRALVRRILQWTALLVVICGLALLAYYLNIHYQSVYESHVVSLTNDKEAGTAIWAKDCQTAQKAYTNCNQAKMDSLINVEHQAREEAIKFLFDTVAFFDWIGCGAGSVCRDNFREYWLSYVALLRGVGALGTIICLGVIYFIVWKPVSILLQLPDLMDELRRTKPPRSSHRLLVTSAHAEPESRGLAQYNVRRAIDID